MAIQIPNPGTGNGATGDNEFVLWSKVKDNFTNTTHAATRLVGKAAGNVMEVGAFGIGSSSITAKIPSEFGFYNGSASLVVPEGMPADNSLLYGTMISMVRAPNVNTLAFGAGFITFTETNKDTGELIRHTKVYTDRNTTKDTATGFLKASSPVLHVYNDSITKIHEAEQLDITVDKKGVGHYEIHGTTGLRKNDGWFMSPPRDVHANVLCMVDLEEKDGVVILKTYKKLFDFETVAIVHDYDNPMDIPEGVCVEFRFNDLPEEQLDEPIE